MTKIRELEIERARISREINIINEAEADADNVALVGKFFRYRNCFSCPQSEADYWWLYIKILRAESGLLYAFRFQTDSNGNVRIEPSHISTTSDRQREITESEFNTAWMDMLESVGVPTIEKLP